jgi:hypothetical protein
MEGGVASAEAKAEAEAGVAIVEGAVAILDQGSAAVLAG